MVALVAMSLRRGWVKEPRSSIHPESSPGAGHQAVEFSPSTAAVADFLGWAPPKAVASAAEEETATEPPWVSTWVSGPAEG